MVRRDAHEELEAARQATFAGVPWQRCQFHLAQNAMQHTPKVELRKQVADDLRNIFAARNAHDAPEELCRFVERYKDTAPKLAAWAEANIPEGLTIFRIPAEHRKRMRKTSMLERQNREHKRRTRVATLFPNEATLLRLVTAILVELSDEWETGMKPLTFQNENPTGRFYKMDVSLSALHEPSQRIQAFASLTHPLRIGHAVFHPLPSHFKRLPILASETLHGSLRSII